MVEKEKSKKCRGGKNFDLYGVGPGVGLYPGCLVAPVGQPPLQEPKHRLSGECPRGFVAGNLKIRKSHQFNVNYFRYLEQIYVLNPRHRCWVAVTESPGKHSKGRARGVDALLQVTNATSRSTDRSITLSIFPSSLNASYTPLILYVFTCSPSSPTPTPTPEVTAMHPSHNHINP